MGRIHQPGHRRNIHDMAASLGLKQRYKRLASTNYTQQVDVNDPLPVIEGRLINFSVSRDSCIVYEKVQPSPSRPKLLQQSFKTAVLTHITVEVKACSS